MPAWRTSSPDWRISLSLLPLHWVGFDLAGWSCLPPQERTESSFQGHIRALPGASPPARMQGQSWVWGVFLGLCIQEDRPPGLCWPPLAPMPAGPCLCLT